MSSATTGVLDPVLDGGTILPPPPRGDGPELPSLPSLAEPPPVSNARLAMLGFIVFESMLFVPLMGGFVVLRWGSPVWPPPGQPYLPIAITWVNTLVLLGSSVPLAFAARGLRRGSKTPYVRGLSAAAAMGALFLAVQGYEWTRLLAHGMTVGGGVYGGIFLILIGTHALHVLGAVVWLATVALLAAVGRVGETRDTAFVLCRMYWAFVCILWVVLFGLVYLA